MVATALDRLDMFSYVRYLAKAEKRCMRPDKPVIAAAKLIKRLALRGDERAKDVIKHFDGTNMQRLLRN
jgi:hypothetical protein